MLYKTGVARFPTTTAPAEAVERGQGADADSPLEVIEGVVELGDEAIIAQESEPHLPQKRAGIQDEPHSIVISDRQPAVRQTPAYRAERAEPTLVIRDRRELEEMRRKVLEERQQRAHASQPPAAPAPRGPYLWAGLAVAAFAAGGVLTFFLVRGTDSAPAELPAAAGLATTHPHAAALSRASSVRNSPAREGAEEPTPQVKLEELPLEKKPRRR